MHRRAAAGLASRIAAGIAVTGTPCLPPHAVLLLAAGSSRRLGQPKQLLRRDGETLVHRAARLGAATLPRRLVVVLAEQAGPIADALADLDHRSVLNLAPQRGLAGSLQAAAPLLRDMPRVLVMTCDQPTLTAAHLERLLHAARTATSGCAATRLAGSAGVPAVVPGDWFAALGTPDDDRGFRARLRALPADALSLVDGPGLEQDIDTPDDLAAARAAGLIDP